MTGRVPGKWIEPLFGDCASPTHWGWPIFFRLQPPAQGLYPSCSAPYATLALCAGVAAGKLRGQSVQSQDESVAAPAKKCHWPNEDAT